MDIIKTNRKRFTSPLIKKRFFNQFSISEFTETIDRYYNKIYSIYLSFKYFKFNLPLNIKNTKIAFSFASSLPFQNSSKLKFYEKVKL